jgi:hypothetical protein
MNFQDYLEKTYPTTVTRLAFDIRCLRNQVPKNLTQTQMAERVGNKI